MEFIMENNASGGRGQIDEVLENALQRRDFALIRTVLQHEGYELPAYEPDDTFSPEGWGDDEGPDDSRPIEIAVTPDEHHWLTCIGPLEPCEEPSPEAAAMLEAFTEEWEKNMPRSLERHIRREDIDGLRMMLLLCGYRISSHDPSTEHDVPDDMPEPPGNF